MGPIRARNPDVVSRIFGGLRWVTQLGLDLCVTGTSSIWCSRDGPCCILRPTRGPELGPPRFPQTRAHSSDQGLLSLLSKPRWVRSTGRLIWQQLVPRTRASLHPGGPVQVAQVPPLLRNYRNKLPTFSDARRTSLQSSPPSTTTLRQSFMTG